MAFDCAYNSQISSQIALNLRHADCVSRKATLGGNKYLGNNELWYKDRPTAQNKWDILHVE